MNTKLVALTVALTAAATSVAHAQAPGETAPLSAPASPRDNEDPLSTPTRPTGDEGPKSADTALMLSLGGTAASLGLVIAGSSSNNGDLVAAGVLSSLVTPSFGQWYAGKPLTAGMGIRLVSGGAFVLGVAEAFACFDETNCSNNNGTAGVLLAGGLVGYATGVIYDIATAPGAAREYNRAHAWRVQPAVLRAPSGTSTMGIGIGGTF